MKRSKVKKGRMINRTIHAATLGLFLGWFCLGCGEGTLEPSVPVPADCQQFLVKYFEAVKAKDVGKIQEFSSYVSRADSKGMSDKELAMMRETKRKFAADTFERMIKECGDFRSYSVSGVKVNTIAANTVAANMMGAGIHAEITCNAKFSRNKSVHIGLHLFKETQDSEFSILAWKYQMDL
jgi:hypothetical protein